MRWADATLVWQRRGRRGSWKRNLVNRKVNELEFPHAAPPPRGTTLEVAPGVRWLRMGLPFALDHINLWLLRDEIDARQGWTIVDCGISNDETRAAWESIFASELQGLPVLRVIVTHMHPDHMGLADWLTERWGCMMWISATDFNVARMASAGANGGFGGDSAVQFAKLHGIHDPQTLDKLRQRSGYYQSMVPSVPSRFRRLMDGMDVVIGGHPWQCIAGYGHAPEHMALHAATLGVLISGDMLLPRISTNVMVVELEPESDPLTLFLTSIRRFNDLPAETLVLPSHGLPFRGMHRRVAQLIEHHDERFELVLQTCRAQPTTAFELLPLLFHRSLDFHQITFAIGESIAHLHALWFQGKLERRLGADGVCRFATR